MAVSRLIGAFLLFLALTLLLGGCQAKSEYWINPDGSGKVVLNYSYRPRLDQPTTMPPDLAAQSWLRTWSGIQTWSNMKYASEGAGYRLEVTGYFKDIREVHATGPIGFIQPVVTMEDGKITSVGFITDPASQTKPEPPPPDGIVEKAYANPVDKFRDHCNRQLFTDTPFHAQEERLLRALHAEYIIHAPGTIKDKGKLDLVNAHTIRLVLDGGKYLDYCIDVIRDDDSAAKAVESHPLPQDYYIDPEVWSDFVEKTCGAKASLSATVTPEDKPLFDYDAEIKAHEEPYATMTKNAGLTPALPEKNADNQLQSIEFTRDVNGRNIIAGQTRATFDGFLEYGEITKMVDDNDQVVIPAMAGNSELKVSKKEIGLDPTSRFKISLAMQNPPARIKLLQGYLIGIQSDGSQKQMLGPIEVKAGASTMDGLVILPDVVPIMNAGRDDELIQLAVDSSKFINQVLIQYEGRGPSGMGPGRGLWFAGQGYFTAGGLCRMPMTPIRLPMAKITITRLIDPRVIKIPFELHDISTQ